MPLDFLNLSQINFSFPFVDAIRVSTYVNLEVQADFITEMARQTALPINRFTGDATNIFNISLQDVNISTSIEDIDVRV
ncbi:MAG: hypothetical protein LBF15_02340 [Candidatus Peribacteria bacterium]|nr:hypothetical protein [Candidatus Peribacteria bacterium]